MGEVWEARDLSLGRRVALKVLPLASAGSEDALRRFSREAQAASSLNHPSIVTIYEIGRAALGADASTTINFIAMELIDGKTLRSLLREKSDLPKLLHVLAQAADGLAKAHAAGIVHRDLKPENLMITSDGLTKILDFGLAKSSEAGADDQDAPTAVQADRITREGMVVGTVGYMSPEQVHGKQVDQRSDIFSFGCILYEAATRQQPFRGNSAVDTLHKIAHEPPAPIGQIDPPVSDALLRVIRKCLAKDPDERYQSTKEIAIDLRDIRKEYDSGERPKGSNGHVQPVGIVRSPSRRRVLLSATLVAVLAVAALAWTALKPRPRDDRDQFEGLSVTRVPNTSDAVQARISPDGRYLALVNKTNAGDRIVVRQLSSGSEIEVAPADGDSYRMLGFSKDGEALRYIHKRTLTQRPILGGTAKTLIEEFDHAVSMSPDESRCAYARDGSIFISNADGSGGRRIAGATKREFYGSPAWSPRGDVIACTRKSLIGNVSQWVEIIRPSDDALAETAARPTVVGERWMLVASPVWIPDGTALIVGVSRGPFESQLYEITYPEGATRRITNDQYLYSGGSITGDGSTFVSLQADKRASIWLMPVGKPDAAKRLVEGVGMVWGLRTAPDGNLLFTSNAEGDSDIWECAADGTARRRLTEGDPDDDSAAISPDGRRIAFVSDRSGQRSIWMMDRDGSHPVAITSGGWENQPTFTPDGKALVYTTRTGGAPTMCTIPVDGGSPKVIQRTWVIRPSVSPDGTMIAAVDDESWSLGVVSADGTPIRDFDVTANGHLRWTPDSKAIAFERGGKIFLQNLAGGEPTQLCDFEPDEILSFDWTPDGQSLVLVRTTAQSSVVLIKSFR